jgi:hypothetical protein
MVVVLEPKSTNFDDYVELDLYRSVKHNVAVKPELLVPGSTAVIKFYAKELDMSGPEVILFQANCAVVDTLEASQITLSPTEAYPVGFYFYRLWLNFAGLPFACIIQGRVRVRF